VNFNEAKEYLSGLIDYEKTAGYPASLEPFLEFLENLGSPHRRLPNPILIVGTKGKGSTAYFIEAGLLSCGYRTGLFSSPHLVDIRERIRLNGELIEEERFVRYLGELYPYIEEKRGMITFFETLFTIAILYFLEEKTDFVILEAGLGGRLDATNTADQILTVITPISLDHTHILGDNLRLIAKEKCAVIKNNSPVVSARQEDEVISIIEESTRKSGSPLFLFGRDFNCNVSSLRVDRTDFEVISKDRINYSVPTLGRYQAENATLAHKALEVIGIDNFSFDGIKLRGRMELMRKNPYLVLDSAHNPFSIRHLFDNIEQIFDYRRLFVVLGISKDKDIESILSIVKERAFMLIFTEAKVKRALSITELSEVARRIGIDNFSLVVDVSNALRKALDLADREDLILITGSFYVVGEAMVYMRGIKKPTGYLL